MSSSEPPDQFKTKLGKKHSRGNGFQICLNKGPVGVLRGDILERVKIRLGVLKTISFITTGPIASTFYTTHPFGNGFQVYFN